MNTSTMSEDKPVTGAIIAEARKFISGSAPFVLGHYPDDAIFPGVMSLQYMKELCEQHFLDAYGVQWALIVMKRVSYLDIIRPGDVLDIEARVKKQSDKSVIYQSTIQVDGVTRAKSSFEFSFKD